MWRSKKKNRFWHFLAIFDPTLTQENGRNSRTRSARPIILYIFEIPETRENRIRSRILIWQIAKKVDFFEFGAKKFAYFKIRKKCQIKVGIDEGNNFAVEHFLIRARQKKK